MLRQILSVLALIVGGSVWSQAPLPVARYASSYHPTGTYTPLPANATEVFEGLDWDDEYSDDIALPFEFKYQGVVVNTVNIETYGTLILNGAENDFGLGHIMGYYMDYESKNRGRIFHHTDGAVGNRIFKVEYRNVGRYSDSIGTDTINFQIWLHEQNNVIEYRAGYSNVPDSVFASTLIEMENGEEFFLTGLVHNEGTLISDDYTNSNIHFLSNSSGSFNDTLVSMEVLVNPAINFDYSRVLMTSFPPNGSVLRFDPIIVPSSITPLAQIVTDVFPNPSDNGLFIVALQKEMPLGTEVVVYNVLGQEVYRQAISGKTTKINMTQFAKGTYVGKLATADSQGEFQLIIK